MPTNDPIAAARREAKSRARKGGITHQQALDEIAREAGHANWTAMCEPKPLRGPSVFLPSEMHEMQFLDPPGAAMPPVSSHIPEEAPGTPPVAALLALPAPAPTLADVERETREIMEKAKASRRAGLRLSEWVGLRMREAAARAIDGYAARDHRHHEIRSLPLNAQMMAQAVDPMGGPWEDRKQLTVRCPLHDDTNGSLVIAGSGTGIGMCCMAGCDDDAVQNRALARLAECAVAAAAFMRANDHAKVVSGHGRGEAGVGGRGGVYILTDGSRHELDVLTCRMLAEGYPDWIHGDVPKRCYAVETAIRIALAGRHRLTVDQPVDPRKGVWHLDIERGPVWMKREEGRPGYSVTVQWQKGAPFGVSGSWSDDPHPFTVRVDEQYRTIEETVARVTQLLETCETTDPEVIAANKARVERERAHHERNSGTDEEGWGWWAGPDDTEFTWGGPYRSQAYAISMANGHCQEKGEVFYVVQARTVDDEPGEDGMREFREIRGLKRCRAT